jgi:DMSO reductase family type II enzyme heme b subunit
MKRRVQLIPAPTSPQPGTYVARAYPERSAPLTPWAEIELRPVGRGGAWETVLHWPCPEADRCADAEPSRFVDAAALLAPASREVPWTTMGAPGLAVVGALWRADQQDLIEIRAEGLGTVVRKPAPASWRVGSEWEGGAWQLRFVLEGWRELERTGLIGLAVWRGVESERGGLKSISPGWLELAE